MGILSRFSKTAKQPEPGSLGLSEIAAAMPPLAPPPPPEPPATRPSPWEPVLYAEWEKLLPPRDLWLGPNDSLVHVLRKPFEYFAYLTLLCNMREDAAVLEIGCSHGRTMLGLLDYLKAPGRYIGFDVVRPQVEFALQNIRPDAFPVRFVFADLKNGVYNPDGALDAATYRFPANDREMDVVFAASPFTHLLPGTVTNYLKETRRVLKRHAHALFSFFLLDYYQGPGTTKDRLFEFDHRLPGHPGVAVHDPENPEAAVAYERDVLLKMAAAAGLTVKRVVPGLWSRDSRVAVHERELVLFEAV